MIFMFLIVQHFIFYELNFILLCPYLIKYYDIVHIIFVFWLGNALQTFIFISTLLFSLLTPLFLSASSVVLSYFNLALPMRECLG